MSLKAIQKKKLRMRTKLWPDVSGEDLWHRKTSDGWVTLPRAFPIILRIMDVLADKGKPVSPTYLDLWCRTYDDSFVVASKPQEMAFYAGFTGQRAQHTWTGRVRQLAELGFIRLANGATGPAHYVLLLNPFRVIKEHIEAGRVSAAFENTLTDRMIEIGAGDLDDEEDDDEVDED